MPAGSSGLPDEPWVLRVSMAETKTDDFFDNLLLFWFLP